MAGNVCWKMNVLSSRSDGWRWLCTETTSSGRLFQIRGAQISRDYWVWAGRGGWHPFSGVRRRSSHFVSLSCNFRRQRGAPHSDVIIYHFPRPPCSADTRPHRSTASSPNERLYRTLIYACV